jgi:hypothetical protein
MAGEVYFIVRLRLLDLTGARAEELALASDRRLALLACGANHSAEELEVAGGKVLLVPLVGLAEWERKIRVTGLNIETRASAPQMNLRSGLRICVMKHYHSLPSTIKVRARGDVIQPHAHRHYLL